MNRSECSWYTKFPVSSFNSIFKHEKPKAYRNENALVDHRDPTYILATRIPNRKGIEISLSWNSSLSIHPSSRYSQYQHARNLA